MNNSKRDSVETTGENACCIGIVEASKLAVYSQACSSKSFIEHIISASMILSSWTAHHSLFFVIVE
jgi:hypothetical protein